MDKRLLNVLIFIMKTLPGTLCSLKVNIVCFC